MTFTVEYEQEDDGRWLAEVLELPGVLAYGETSDDAIAKAQALRVATSPSSEGEMSEDEIDRNLKETFPASDPPSWTLGTDHREEPASERSDDDEGSDAQ